VKGPALVVMARAPLPGGVKTRLQPHLSPGQCAELYLSFLRDAIDLAVSVPPFTPFMAFTPEKEEAFFRGLVRGSDVSVRPVGLGRAESRMELVPQARGDLGRRMQALMSQLEYRDYSPIVIVGSDLPALQPATLLRSLECLQSSDLCLGPCPDGGYYLVGARHSSAALFRGIPWSTPRVLTTTLERAKSAGISVSLLEECADVDTFDDLERLRADMELLRRTPGATVPRHTGKWMKESGIYSA